MLDLNKQKLPQPKERMLVAFDDDNAPRIVCRRGPCIEHEDRSTDPEDLGISSPSHIQGLGLWVYEVVPSFVEDHSDGLKDYGYFEYDSGSWRRPNDAEWAYIRNGDLVGLFGICWVDVTSAAEWDEKVKKAEDEKK